MADNDWNKSESGILYPTSFPYRTVFKDQAVAMEKADQAAIASSVRKLNDLDRDGTADHLAGTIEDSRDPSPAVRVGAMAHPAAIGVLERDYEPLGRSVAEMTGIKVSNDFEGALEGSRAFGTHGSPEYPFSFDAQSERDVFVAIGRHAEDLSVEVVQDDRVLISAAVLDRVSAQVMAWDREQREAAIAPELAQELPGRWTIQEFKEEKGVYVDVMATNDVLLADEMLRSSQHVRVLDNELGDYAADYPDRGAGVNAEPNYHARSQFGAMVNAAEAAAEVDAQEHALTATPNAGIEVRADIAGDATRADWQQGAQAAFRDESEYQEMLRSLQRPQSLQEAVDRRAILQERVDLHSEAVAMAVDRLHTPGADADQVKQAYETAAKDYVAAQQGMSDFRREPSAVPEVVAKFHELEAAELAADQARQNAVGARVDGAAVDALALAAAAEKTAQERVERVLQREGVTLPVAAGQRTDNSIERGLSDEQIQKLVTGDRGQKRSVESVDAPPPVAKQAEGHNQVRDFSAFADAAAKDKLIPDAVASAYRRDGDKFLDPNDPKRVAFVDKGNRLQTARTFDDKAVADMIETADARGWTEITLKGDEAFRRKAWIEATARGIEAKGYEPTEQDKTRAEQLGKQTGHANAIEKNETLDAYRASRDSGPKEKRDAARTHPDLANAYALEAAAASFAKQRLAPQDQARFVERTRENIERDLAQGKQIPEIRRRQETDRRQEHGMER